MGADQDLAVMVEQERLLQFGEFSADTAWAVGTRMRGMAAGAAKPVAMAISVAGQTMFYAATNGVTPGNEDWLRRKRNTVLRFGRSSLRVGTELAMAGTTLEAKQGLTLAEYAAHGGGFPVLLRGTGCVGAVVVSGLTQREDHAMAVMAMATVLGVEVPRLALA